MGGASAGFIAEIEVVMPVRSALEYRHGAIINNGGLPRVLVGGPSWWLGPAKRPLPRPGGGRPRLRWTRAFDWAISRREPFQGPWVSVELSTCS